MWLRVRGFSQKRELWEGLKEGFFFFFNVFTCYFFVFILGCTVSSLLRVGFLWLRQAGLSFVAVLGLLTAVASAVAEHWPRVHVLQ